MTSIEEFKKEIAEKIQKNIETTMVLNDFNDFMDIIYKEESYIVNKLLIRDGLNMISGSAGVGKTFISLEYIIKIATGKSVFGEFKTGQPIPVLLLNEEDHPRSIQQRVKLMTKERDLPIYFLLRQSFKIDDEKTCTAILNKCLELKIKLLVLDNLTQIHGLDENKADEIKKVLFQLKRFTKKDITILLLHHHRKSGTYGGIYGDEIRGSSVIHGSMDSHVTIERTPDTSTFSIMIRQTKNKEGELLKNPFIVELLKSDNSLSCVYRGEKDEDFTALQKAQNEIKEFFDKGDRELYKSITELKNILKNIREKTIKDALKGLVNAGILGKKTRKELNNNNGNPNEKLYYRIIDYDPQTNLFNLPNF